MADSSGNRGARAGAIEVRIALPAWLAGRPAPAALPDDAARMRYVVELARENVERDTGGPFAAAIIESASGRVVAAGVNLVVPMRSSILHAEIVALLLAQRRLGSHVLSAPGMPAHELVASCDPCAMCLGAAFWSGVRRLVCGASREDAERIGFDEGPVFEASYDYLESRKIEIVRGVERNAAADVLELYRQRSGVIYNG